MDDGSSSACLVTKGSVGVYDTGQKAFYIYTLRTCLSIFYIAYDR